MQRPLRGWKSWWATYEMDRRSKQGGRGADGARVGGGFASMRSWGLPRAATVFTLLLLTLFTGAIALGARSIAAAIVAFVFFGAALAVVTAARARQIYAARPAETTSPLETVADFHINDLKIDDDVEAGEVNSLDDLEVSLGKQSPLDDPERIDDLAEAVADGPPATTPTDKASDAEKEPAPEDAPIPMPAASEDARETEKPADAVKPGDSSDAAPPADTPLEATAADALIDEAVSEGIPEAADETSDDEDDTDDDTDPAEPDTDLPDAAEPIDDDELAALMEPLIAYENQSNGDADARAEDSAPDTDERPEAPVKATALSLLAAETPGADLLRAYNASETQLPPEAVRDVAATLIVSDLQRSMMFYTELLGLVEIDRAPDAVLLEAGFGRVLLWRRDDAPGAGDPVMHLTFEVGDIDSAYETLRAKGVEFTHPPVSALTGEVHDLRAASFLDPDGHGLAITELRQR
ncbi:MAG TPA: VOC family protein [Stackebrandtia sp.]|uniref:VOC family protein n=1 Tax=Stackebrandtia sp. TaxID=2023065 RepID=UPI002D4A585A|nr:VOC family protein [Stackebrandtia sp.]HZE37528.1 VOC family protein [Stackebrandtia sp.]